MTANCSHMPGAPLDPTVIVNRLVTAKEAREFNIQWHAIRDALAAVFEEQDAEQALYDGAGWWGEPSDEARERLTRARQARYEKVAALRKGQG